MQSNNNNSASEKNNAPPSSQIADKKMWPPISRPVPPKLGKKRDHSPEKSPVRRISDGTKEDEGKEKAREETKPQPSTSQQPAATYPSSRYATSDFYSVDPNQNNYMMPQFNMFNAMNQWGAPVSTGMPTMDTPQAFSYVVPTDPTMYGMMGPMAGYCPMPMMNGGMPPMPPKVPKTYANCTLVPPPPGAPRLTRRNRPNGCKTVFVGGLPEKITEEIIREAFSECGEIATVRMSKKNFCHVRFAGEHIVDQAMLLSGWRLKIENKDEAAYSSKIHVDFAVARDDQYEYECLMARDHRHAEEDGRPPSPPPVVNYSESQAAVLGESLRNEETFKRACEVLIHWLDRGECNKRNSGTFYSMIQSTFSHVRRLVAEKAKIEEELTQVKQKLNNQSHANACSFNDIERVFGYASTQKVWDHFTKAQRKHIDMWKRQTADTKVQNLEDLLEERIEDEMEMSDSEDGPSGTAPSSAGRSAAEAQLKEELNKAVEDRDQLQDQAQALNSQLESLNVEMANMKMNKEESDKKISALSDALKLMQQNYLETRKKLDDAKKENTTMVAKQESAVVDDGMKPSTSGAVCIPQDDARIVAVIATFLNVHPSGASIDYICSYFFGLDRNVNPRDIENIMRKYPTVFKEVSTGIGATLERKWIFFGFMYYTNGSDPRF